MARQIGGKYCWMTEKVVRDLSPIEPAGFHIGFLYMGLGAPFSSHLTTFQITKGG